MLKKCFLLLVLFLLICSCCLSDEEAGIRIFRVSDEEAGIRIFRVSDDEPEEDKFESYAELITCLGVEMEAEEIPLYNYYHATDWWDDDSEKEYLSMIQKSLEAKPKSGRLLMYLGDYYYELERNKEEGIRCYQKAYQLKPSDIEIALCYLTACNELDDEKNAMRVFLEVKERLQPIIHGSENDTIVDKAASLYAGALSEMVIICSRHHNFSLADNHLDELFSLPNTNFSRYACGFEALDYYLDISEQLNNQERIEFCSKMILKLYEQAELTYSEASNELYLLNFIYSYVLSKADDYINPN